MIKYTYRSAGRLQAHRPPGWRRSIICFCILFVAAAATAQVDRYAPIAPIPLGDTLFSLPTSHIPAEGTWELKFTHRFNQPIDQGSFSDRIHSLFGLDSKADVGIGASFVPRRDLEFSFYRSNALDDIEFAGKYIVIQQALAIPVSAAVRIGGDWRTEKNLSDRTSEFVQLILSRQFGRHAEVFIIPTFVTNAGRTVNGNTSGALFRNAENVLAGAAVMLRPSLSVVAELYPKNRDLPKQLHGDFGWALGLKRAIGGHYFEILFTDDNATHVDQYVTATYQGAKLQKGSIHIGFNIERRFGK